MHLVDLKIDWPNPIWRKWIKRGSIKSMLVNWNPLKRRRSNIQKRMKSSWLIIGKPLSKAIESLRKLHCFQLSNYSTPPQMTINMPLPYRREISFLHTQYLRTCNLKRKLTPKSQLSTQNIELRSVTPEPSYICAYLLFCSFYFTAN